MCVQPCSILFQFQSTLPQGERHGSIGKLTIKRAVSIHAPARGATLKNMRIVIDGEVSIHAPARGATCIMSEQPDKCYVSIHAPARGATEFAEFRQGGKYSFNPRSREGSDAFPDKIKKCRRLFQSTLPRGERHQNYCLILGRNCFNPRSREGSDLRTISEP